MLSNRNRTLIYVGYTEDIKRRILQHRSGKGSKFTNKYNITDLLYYEVFDSSIEARNRERQLKN